MAVGAFIDSLVIPISANKNISSYLSAVRVLALIDSNIIFS